MGSPTLDLVRSKNSQMEDVSDDELTFYLGSKHPEYLEHDPVLAAEYQQLNPQGMLANFSEGFYKGLAYDLPTSFFGAAEAVTGLVSDTAGDYFEETANEWENAGLNFARRNNLDLDSFSAQVGGGAASLVPMFATGGASNIMLAARGASALAKARTAKAVVYGTIGTQSFGGNFREAKSNYENLGYSKAEATKKAYIPAAASAMGEVVATAAGGYVAGKLGLGGDVEKAAINMFAQPEVRKGVGTVAKTVLDKTARTLGGGAMEGAEEMGASILSSAVAVMSHSPELTLREAAEAAGTSFLVGWTVGTPFAAVNALQSKRLSDKEIATIASLRKAGNEQTADALEKKLRTQATDAAAEVLPDGATVATSETGTAQDSTKRAEDDKDKIYFNQRRTQLIERLRDSEKLPFWWDEYDSPNGMNLASQESVDDFIEDQYLGEELRRYSVMQTDEGFVVSRGKQKLSTVETQAEADAFIRKTALTKLPKDSQDAINENKQLTRTLKKLERLDRINKKAFDERQNATEPEAAKVSEQDLAEVVNKINEPNRRYNETVQDESQKRPIMSVKDLEYAGINVTPEDVENLRYADEAKVQQWLTDKARQDRERAVRDRKQAARAQETKRQSERQRKATEATRGQATLAALQMEQELQSLEESINRRVARGQAELDRAKSATSIDLSAAAQAKLDRGELSEVNQGIVRRLLERKGQAIDAAVDDSGVVGSAVSEIENIDRQLASILGAASPRLVTSESLAQLREARGKGADGEVEEAQESTPQRKIPTEKVTVAGGQVEVDKRIPAELRGQIGKALARVQQSLGSLFDLKQIQFRKMDGGAGVGSLAQQGVSDVILVDPARLERSMKVKGFSLAKALEEEVLHNVDAHAIRAEYYNLKSKGQMPSAWRALQRLDESLMSIDNPNVAQFIQGYYNNISQQMSRAERKAARKIYGSDFQSDIHMAQEFVRQLLQTRHTKKTTEDAYRNGPLRKLLEILSSALSRVKLSVGIQRHLKNIDSFLEKAYTQEIKDAKHKEEKDRIRQHRDKLKENEQVDKAHEFAADKIRAQLRKQGYPAFNSDQYLDAADRAYDAWRAGYESGKWTEEDAPIPTIVRNQTSKAIRGSQKKIPKQTRGKQVSRGGELFEKFSYMPARDDGAQTVPPFTLETEKDVTDLLNETLELIKDTEFSQAERDMMVGDLLEMSDVEMAQLLEISPTHAGRLRKGAWTKIKAYAVVNEQFAEHLEKMLEDATLRRNQQRGGYDVTFAADPAIAEYNQIIDEKKEGYLSKAKAIVKEIGAKAGYQTEGLHGTPAGGFVVFDTKGERMFPEDETSYVTNVSGPDPTAFIGSHFAVEEDSQEVAQRFMRGIYRGSNEIEKVNPKLYEVFLKLENPRVMDADEFANHTLYSSLLVDQDFHGDWWDENHMDYNLPEDPFEATSDDMFSENRHTDNLADAYQFYFSGMLAQADDSVAMSKAQEVGRHIREMLQMEGHDGIIYENEVEGGKAAIAFEPNQIKSADAITRDSEGNVIPLPERFNPKKDEITYAADPTQDKPSAAQKFASTVLTGIGDFGKRLFKIFDSTGGLLMPSLTNSDDMLDFYKTKVSKDGYINSVMTTVQHHTRDLQRAVKAKMPDANEEDILLLNRALQGDNEALSQLDEAIAEPLSIMRQQIDALSQYIIDKDWVTGDLKSKIDENLKVYLARSYRIFDDPKYIDSIEPEVMNRAINVVEKNLLKAGMNSYEAQQAARVKVSEMLEQFSSSTGRDQLNSGRLGHDDLSLFKKKNEDLDPAIRALMGEYTDPVVNYTRTVSRLAHFVGKYQFLADMKTQGMGKVFFSENDFDNRDQYGASVRLGAAKKQRTPKTKKDFARESQEVRDYNPLDGLYTTPEVAQILEAYENGGNLSESNLLRTLAKWNVYSKASKTILSPMTHARNLIGQPLMLVLNGHNPMAFKQYAAAYKALHADILGTGADAKKFQAYFNKLTRLGLVGEETTTAELRRVLNDAASHLDASSTAEDLLGKTTGTGLKKLGKKGRKTFEAISRVYRASDELGKIMAFEMEKAKLKPLYPDFSETQLEDLAAKRTRGGLPTYSEMPPAIQRLRMQPFFGPFMSFFYESLRTQVNNVRYASTELQNGNYMYAARRLGGHLAVTAGSTVVFNVVSEMLGGVGEEEQEAVRSLLPFYEKDSQMFFSRGEDGSINYWNLSFNNPYNATTDPIMALLGVGGMQDSDDLVENMLSKTMSAIAPFTNETIIFQSFIDIARNKNQYGTSVYNDESTIPSKAVDMSWHVAKAFMPGGVSRFFNRGVPALRDQTLPSGEKPEFGDYIQNELLGVQRKTLDYREALSKSSKRINRRLGNANYNFNRQAGSVGSVSDSEMIDGYIEANEARLRIFKVLDKQISAARLGGLKDGEIMARLTADGITKTDAAHAMSGRFRPLMPSAQIRRNAAKAGHPIPFGEIMPIYKNYAGKSID